MTETPHTFRKAGEQDLPGIAELLLERDGGTGLLDSLRWKYRKGPDGPGEILIAENPDGRIVGMMAYLPRQFTSHRTGRFCLMQGVDAFVPEALRGKGIYSGITALARREMNVPKIAFPNELSIGFGVKFGWRTLAPLRIWRFPVALGLSWSESPFRFLAPLVNGFSWLYTACWTGPTPRGLRMQAVGRFEKDYTERGDRIQGIRTAEYLNWRFIDNPMRDYSAYEFLHHDETIGYCVYAKRGFSADIFDFATTRRRRGCLRLLVEHIRREQVSHLCIRGIHLRVARLGFLPGGTHRECIVFKAPKGDWMISMCDSDW
jgi:hypothetical protein